MLLQCYSNATPKLPQSALKLAAAPVQHGLAAQSEASLSFEFASGAPAYDQAYQKARRVLAADVKEGKFLAGQNWAQVWTRDTSYSD